VERRFVIFLVLTMLIWTGFIILRVNFAPQRPPVAEKAADEAAKAPDIKLGPQDTEPDPPAVVEKKDEQQPQAQTDAAPGAAERPTAPLTRVTLGSLDPTSPYRMLVTCLSKGAAVERVELNSPKYKSVEDQSGYLGNLALSDAKDGGAEVNIVGPGTPAALAQATGNLSAGLQVGDVILSVNELRVDTAAALENYLKEKTRPGDRIPLGVQRAGVSEPIQIFATLTRVPLEVVRPEVPTYTMPGGDLRTLPQNPLSLLVGLDYLGGRALTAKEIESLPSLHDSNWTLDQQGPDFVEFSFTLDEPALAKIGKQGVWKIVKRYTLAKIENAEDRAYHLDLRISLHNLGGEPQQVAYRFDGPTGLPTEGWWYSTKLHPEMWAGAGARDVAFKQAGFRHHRLVGCSEIVDEAQTAIEEDKQPLIPLLTGDQAAAVDYIGVDTQFFAGAVRPQPMSNEEPIKFRAAYAMPVQDVGRIPKNRLRTADVSFRLTSSPTTIQPGGVLTHDYLVFFGPKDPHVLDQYQLASFIEYGWKIFAYPAIWLLHLLNGLYWFTGMIGIPNYGIAIILLTMIVRTCMIPVSLKQARMAAKMQELAPEIQKIKEKFPDDPMKQHAAVQELYKKHNFNMFGGCLPVFIQLPIFIGLYRCLSVDIDLRDASLIPGIAWASNLAGPDQLFYWKDWVWSIIGDEADGWLGPYFNVFPLITVTLFLVQQKMFTPPATDEQTRMQQQMMTYMTIFMGVMFYKVPAGLCIYFITSSLWGICERKLLPKMKPAEASASRGGDGRGGLAALLPAKPAGPNGSTKPPPRKQKQRK
jgi:YidC/Oxa1 family membrane protein insertase